MAKKQNDKKYKNPDRLNSAKQELRRLIPEYQPISGSQAIAQYLDLENNSSKSFQVFLEGLSRIVKHIPKK